MLVLSSQIFTDLESCMNNWNVLTYTTNYLRIENGWWENEILSIDSYGHWAVFEYVCVLSYEFSNTFEIVHLKSVYNCISSVFKYNSIWLFLNTQSKYILGSRYDDRNLFKTHNSWKVGTGTLLSYKLSVYEQGTYIHVYNTILICPKLVFQSKPQ